MSRIILLDSCVLIDLMQDKNPVSDNLKPLVEAAKRDELVLAFSSVSRAEIMYLKDFSAKGHSQEEQSKLIAGLLNEDYLKERLVDREVGDVAADLRRKIGTQMDKKILTPVDSIILSTAQTISAEVVVTTDGGKGAKKDSNGNTPVGLLELDGYFGSDFPVIRDPGDIPGQSGMQV